MDFTVRKYSVLLQFLIEKKYHFQTLEDFLKLPKEKTIILRHDVDLLPENALVFAKIQNEYNIKGVYYFRAVPESWNEQIIQKISALGHEVGYHYECLTTCRGDFQKGLADFEQNLERLRKLVPVSTICMHGSPLSKFDSRDLWKSHSYRDFGIIGEPYFDIDFSKVLYLTDTGRRWDGDKVSVRDKVGSKNHPFKTTCDIIAAANAGQLSAQIMFTFHPQRWHDHSVPWVKELVLQNAKNVIKKYFFVKNT